MTSSAEAIAKPRLLGRSSSHFTRVARIFAAEAGVDHTFDIVTDLMSSEPADYAGNPALKMPVLTTPHDIWFGASNICRALTRLSARPLRVAWPEDLPGALLANAQELTVHAMATDVGLVMAGLPGDDVASPSQLKMRKSLLNTMSWLEANVEAALLVLPMERDLSYLEVTLFCLVAHLDFRGVLAMAPYSRLTAFRQRYGERAAAKATAYRFDT